MNYGGDLEGLQERLSNFCKRTLRSQVVEYISYTERKLITRPFKPTEQEHKLYEAISRYLMRDDTYAFPARNKHLLIMLIRKVLSSSPRALSGTLEIIRNRLQLIYDQAKTDAPISDVLFAEDEFEDDLLDEILEDNEDDIDLPEINNEDTNKCEEIKINLSLLKKEIEEIEQYIRWAHLIGVDTKSKVLLKALKIGFSKMGDMGAAEKVVIFTESRRTQDWLFEFLERNGYEGTVITFNGTNKSDLNKSIYAQWLEDNKDTGRISNSKAIDMRAAILDYFKNSAKILIATEAGAEGLNMQFCSLVINFDLPWNPQRIDLIPF
jgi:hypothetical protein